MAFVAEELGVEVVDVPQLHREISPILDPLSVARVVQLIRRVRPHILHTHTAKAGAVGRIAALLAGDARPPIVVHTFHGHVLRGYFDPVRTAVFRRSSGRSPGRRRGSSRSAPRCATTSSSSASRRRRSSRSSGSGSTSTTGSPSGDGDGRALRRLFGVPDGRLRRRLDRPDDGDQAPPGRARRVRAALERGVDATLCLVGDGPDREAVERARARARHRPAHPVRRLPARRRPVLRALRRAAPAVRERGDAGGRDRVARRRNAGRGDRRRRRSGRRRGRRRRVPRPASATSTRSPPRSSGWRATPSCAASIGQAGRERTVPRYRVDRLVDDVDALYRELLAERGPALPWPSNP